MLISYLLLTFIDSTTALMYHFQQCGQYAFLNINECIYIYIYIYIYMHLRVGSEM